METFLDTAWCPVCDRAIQPKRYTIPANPTPPPPSTPTDTNRTPKAKAQSSRHPKNGGGLVNGTGRAYKRGKKDSPPPQPSEPIKMRTVISQEPVPLYCSEECRLRDIGGSDDCDTQPLRVPHNSPCHNPPSPLFVSSGTESDSSESASYSPSEVRRRLESGEGIDLLPIPSLVPRRPQRSRRPSTPPAGRESGTMAAAQRIMAALAPPPTSKSTFFGETQRKKDRQPIPGWTDGDRTAWRASVYGGVASDFDVTRVDLSHPSGSGSYAAMNARRAAASLANDEGVHIRQPMQPLEPRTTGRSAPQPSTADLYEKYHASFVRTSRSSSLALLPAAPSPLSSSVTAHPLVKAAAEGKLLVPNLKSMAPQRSSSSVSVTQSPRRGPSLLSQMLKRADEELSSNSSTASDTSSRNRACELHFFLLQILFLISLIARSLSRDRVHTVSKLAQPTRMEKHTQFVWIPAPDNTSREEGIGEGHWESREVDVEVPDDRKRLFRFA
ncbi:hypothetical protein SISSUDRAFT_495387 [Sistotremastrum suecicum HHB10207 ss-3]|uniref:Uncharacterized protein n=1 Tax=Sistotremastrum suecicum HHB10207 ss-3 TaxID=1314776 RepID=A0A166IHY5_9AGAM|nr:hypothetical protein SISSUDRAFT_495387 [Sistotremastrum suecicum HHB10207 ss-3]